MERVMIRSDEPVGRRVKQFDQRTTLLDQCLHSAGAARALGGSPGLNEPTPYAGRSSRRRSRRPFINIKFHRRPFAMVLAGNDCLPGALQFRERKGF
jgi:hypothetical protein